MFRLARQRTTQVSEVTRKRATIIASKASNGTHNPAITCYRTFETIRQQVLVVEARGVVRGASQAMTTLAARAEFNRHEPGGPGALPVERNCVGQEGSQQVLLSPEVGTAGLLDNLGAFLTRTNSRPERIYQRS